MQTTNKKLKDFIEKIKERNKQIILRKIEKKEKETFNKFIKEYLKIDCI